MAADSHLRLDEVAERVCDIVCENLGLQRDQTSPKSRFIEDFGSDSLDYIEMVLAVEEAIGITLPESGSNPVYKAVFTRLPFRIADLAELVYLQQGSGTPEYRGGFWRRKRIEPRPPSTVPFTQLGGRWEGSANDRFPLLEPLDTKGGPVQYRRRSDGMRCIRIPGDTAEIGCDRPDAPADQKPKHSVRIEPFLIDAEPVSTVAYSRFLNSIGGTDHKMLAEWCLLEERDHRLPHCPVILDGAAWQPVPGTDRKPMVLVSWHGANAYSLWANGRNWRNWRGEESYLPSEAQWEYAARGKSYREFPWVEGPPTDELMRFGQHRRTATYRAEDLPMADANAELGMSPFGLHHMAGNVWQWCRDWYDDVFYRSGEAYTSNPLNRKATGIRSEHGGSWIGPAELSRSSYLRGRPPAAMGRCLGFRCTSPLSESNEIEES